MKNNITDKRKLHYKSNKVDTARNRIHLGEKQITGMDKRAKVINVNTEGKGRE